MMEGKTGKRGNRETMYRTNGTMAYEERGGRSERTKERTNAEARGPAKQRSRASLHMRDPG